MDNFLGVVFKGGPFFTSKKNQMEKCTLTPADHRRELGVVTRDGEVYLNPFRKVHGAIKNRLFTPKWVEQAFDQGKIVVDATVETKIDTRSGRHYPVVRGKVVDDAPVSTYLSFASEVMGDYLEEEITWASGKKEVRKWPSYDQVPADVMAAITPNNRRQLEATAHHRRLRRIMRLRYNNGAPSAEVKGIYSLAKVEYDFGSIDILRRSMMIEVTRTYSAAAVWTKYKYEVTGERPRFVKVVEEGPDCPIVRRMEPIDAHFQVVRSKPYLKLRQWESTHHYESNDGRGTRCDTTRYLSLKEVVDVQLLDQEGNKAFSWREEDLVCQVAM